MILIHTLSFYFQLLPSIFVFEQLFLFLVGRFLHFCLSCTFLSVSWTVYPTWAIIFKGRISKKWWRVQYFSNSQNPETRKKRGYKIQSWMIGTIKLLVELSLGTFSHRGAIAIINTKRQRWSNSNKDKSRNVISIERYSLAIRKYRT